MARLGGTPRTLPDQPVATVDPEVERLAHVMVDGLIERLAAEPAVPATSLLDNLAEQLQQAATCVASMSGAACPGRPRPPRRPRPHGGQRRGRPRRDNPQQPAQADQLVS